MLVQLLGLLRIPKQSKCGTYARGAVSANDVIFLKKNTRQSKCNKYWFYTEYDIYYIYFRYSSKFTNIPNKQILQK